MNLSGLGWSNWFAERFAVYADRGFFPGRVVSTSRELYRLETEPGPVAARPSGRMRRGSTGRVDFPVVGDWVAADLAGGTGAAVIHAVLPRRSKFSRKVTGVVTEEQVIAANVDTVFLVNALDNDFNPRRLERYLALARESGADPVVILSKSDLCDCPAQRAAEMAAVAGGSPVHLISSVTGAGFDGLERYLAAGKTVVLLGSSGAGKSTLLNRLAGTERQKVQAVRRGDDRGRHTTSRSELFRLSPGALVIDTPGLRELQLGAVARESAKLLRMSGSSPPAAVSTTAATGKSRAAPCGRRCNRASSIRSVLGATLSCSVSWLSWNGAATTGPARSSRPGGKLSARRCAKEKNSNSLKAFRRYPPFPGCSIRGNV